MARFEKLPNEIFESIVVFLDLHDVCSLRLSSRASASKATQDHFKSFFRVKSAPITEQSLQSLVESTKPGELGCIIEELTLVGIANNPKGLESLLRKKTRTVTERNGPMFVSTEKTCDEEELEKARQDLKTLRLRQKRHEELLESGRYVELLAKAFNNVAAYSTNNTLRKLTLEVAVYRQDAETRLVPMSGGGWRYIWQSTAETYQVSMNALTASKLPLQSLQIFSGANMRRCSVARDELSGAEFASPGLQTALASINSLSVSLSNKVIMETDDDENRTGDPGDEIDWGTEPEQRDIRELRAEASDERNFSGLAELVALCPLLEAFELHSYSLAGRAGRALRPSDYHDEWLLQRVISRSHGKLRNLQRLKIRGLGLTEEDLYTFVTQSPVKELIMENVFMTAGEYRRLFDYCTSEEASMKSLFFDDLWEQKLVYFAEPGHPKFPSTGGVTGTNTLMRIDEDVRRSISYHFSDGRPLGSPQAYNWRERRRAEYGPP